MAVLPEADIGSHWLPHCDTSLVTRRFLRTSLRAIDFNKVENGPEVVAEDRFVRYSPTGNQLRTGPGNDG